MMYPWITLSNFAFNLNLRRYMMEDLELVRRLRRRSAPAVIPLPVTTSARRWNTLGLLRVTAAGPGRCWIRHVIEFHLTQQTRVQNARRGSMTWRAISARP